MQKIKGNRVIKGSQEDNPIRQPSTVFPPSNLSSHIRGERHSKSDRRSSITPTPIDFDNFLPWLCREWGEPQIIIVVRANEEEELKFEIEKAASRRLDDIKEEADNDSISKSRDYGTLDLYHLRKHENEEKKNVIIETYYDAQNQLENISFVECRGGISRKVIRAINLCLPFHPKLNRLNICKGGLTPHVLYEITKMLPHSNISIISLDNSIIPEGRYYTLIQDFSQLSYLSLNRCRIHDEICKEIAMNLVFGKPGTNSLNVLELASNNITDIGAIFLGEMLRTNRRLLHLNLAGNKITDVGGIALMNSLMEFVLTDNEASEMKKRRYKCLKKKYLNLRRSLESELVVLYEDPNTSNFSDYAAAKLKPRKSSTVSCQAHPENFEYLDPYPRSNLVLKNGSYFTAGNFVLCSLNLAYNALNYPFLKKVDEVVAYQQRTVDYSIATGLIRIVMDGNYMPVSCPELDRIANSLQSYIDSKQPKPSIVKKRHSSIKSLAKSRSK